MFDNVIKPVAIVLGKFLDVIFTWMDNIGIGNIGIAIIIFTIIVKVAMMPLIFSQQKTVKVTQIMQPEIKAIRAKYKGRTDNESMQMQNREIKEVYAKYGASQTGGCIQLLIQLPILLALYNVFRNLPLYLDRLNSKLANVLSSINTQSNYLETMESNFPGVAWNSHDGAIDGLNTFTAEKWAKLQELFPSASSVIADNSPKILSMNNFLGVHTSISPAEAMGLAILVPILAGVTQFISARLAQNVQGDDRAAKIQAILMSTMMPVISVVFAFRVPAGLGIYWITTAVVQTIMQLIINRYYKNMTPGQIIAKAEEKRIKKLEKKARKKNVDANTLIKSATVKTRNVGSESPAGDNTANASTSFKDRATLSKTPKVKAKGSTTSASGPGSGGGGTTTSSIGYGGTTTTKKIKLKKAFNDTGSAKTAPEPEKPKKGLFRKKDNTEKTVSTDKAAKTAKENKVNKAAKEDKPTKSSKDSGKSLAEMAGKVTEYNEGKGGSKKSKK